MQTLGGLKHYFESLTPETVASMGEFYTDDAYFRDPFNEVHTLRDIQRVFEKMYESLADAHFTILETVDGGATAMLVWNLDYRIRRYQPEVQRRIHGVSHLRLAADGRVAYHRDYWDAAGELYEQLPVIGGALRWLKKRME